MKTLLSILALMIISVSCSSPKERYEDRTSEARQEYEQELKQAQEDYKEEEVEAQKEEATDMIDDSDSVQVNEDEGQIKVED